MKIKVASVFGTRPDTIKMCPLIKELLSHSNLIDSVTIGVAQHRQMMDQALEVFGVKPDYDLDIMVENQSLGEISTRCIERVGKVLEIEKPDIVLVHGDTSTGFSSALAAFYAKIKVGHVEAGLRTNCKMDPFPEEMNRRLIANIADIHFAPTVSHKANLMRETVREESIYVTGNTGIDAVLEVCAKDGEYENEELKKLDLYGKRMILVTSHRRENLGSPMREIFGAIREILAKYEDVVVVFPVHLNPVVQNLANEMLSDIDRCILIRPISYMDMVKLMKSSYMIMTDSGGLQEEAPALDKPVMVLRNTTERPEGVDAGTLLLCGTKREQIVVSAEELLSNGDLYSKMVSAKNPYGDGTASKKTALGILHYFDLAKRPDEFK